MYIVMDQENTEVEKCHLGIYVREMHLLSRGLSWCIFLDLEIELVSIFLSPCTTYFLLKTFRLLCRKAKGRDNAGADKNGGPYWHQIS